MFHYMNLKGSSLGGWLVALYTVDIFFSTMLLHVCIQVVVICDYLLTLCTVVRFQICFFKAVSIGELLFTMCTVISQISGKMWQTVWSWISQLRTFVSARLNGCNVTLYQVSKQISPQYCLLKYLSGPQHQSYLHLRFPGQAQFSRTRFCCCPGKLSGKVSWGESVAWGFDLFWGIVGPSAALNF